MEPAEANPTVPATYASAVHRAWIATVRVHRRDEPTTWTRINPILIAHPLDHEAARRLAVTTTAAIHPPHHAIETAKQEEVIAIGAGLDRRRRRGGKIYHEMICLGETPSATTETTVIPENIEMTEKGHMQVLLAALRFLATGTVVRSR